MANGSMQSAAPPDSFDQASVLIIDDEPNLLRFFEYNVQRMGYRVVSGHSNADMLRLLDQEAFAVILLDLMLPDGEALDHLPMVIERHPRTSVILISAHGTIPKAVAAIQKGAVNFIQKPVNLEQLEAAIRQAVEIWRLKREVQTLRRRLEPSREFLGMVGQSEVMQDIFGVIESVAHTPTPVMITGESGTGKELVAHAIHTLSPRAQRPFIAINCAAIPRDLLESELLGHERGAFTGAVEQRLGCFERADKGTLFLDEICEMDIGLQAKLLRLLQEQSFYRVGGSQLIHVSVRILTATNKDPQRMVEQGLFREDLFYRLNVLPIHLPPLRERREDIMPIARKFLEEVNRRSGKDFLGFNSDAIAAMERYAWPGNIRELQNVIEQVAVLNQGDRIDFSMLPRHIREHIPVASEAGSGALQTGVQGSNEIRPFWQTERDEIQRAIVLSDGNVQEASRRLEISAATLYRKIEKYGLIK